MGAEKAIPGEGEAGPEPTKLPCEDGEGHSEADAPDEHAPVNSPPSLAPSEKGTLWRAAAPVQAEPHDGLGAQA